MDFRNNFLYHTIVALFSAFFIGLLYYWMGIGINRATAGVAFFLLFLTLSIGPIMRLWKPKVESLPMNLPWSWRGELGIWFTILSVVHILIVFYGRKWNIIGYITGMRLSDLVAFVAIFIAFFLTVASFSKVINFLGISSWRWLHSFSYVIFYLVGAHVINHAFLREGRPTDWIHWAYLVMMLVVIFLESVAFIKTVTTYRKSLRKLES